MSLSNKELLIIAVSILILGLTTAYLQSLEAILISIISFILLISANILAKKITAYNLEIDINIKFWELYQFGFRKDSHFKSPLPLFWIPVFFALLTNARIWWLAIFQFDAKPKVERAARRHGRFSYTRVTEWDAGLIAAFGVITNLVIAIIALLIPTELFPFDSFARLNVFYAAWSLLPISNLDGTKILFGSKGIWIILAAITFILTIIVFPM